MQAGDIILTRNLEDNSTPFSFWNHAAIYIGSTGLGLTPFVIEAQAKPNKILRVAWYTFKGRYPEIKVIRINIRDNNRLGDYAEKMVERAEQLVGKPYKKYSSIFFRSGWLRNKLGYNCVGVIKECNRYATGRNVKWRFPDDILKTKHTIIWEKKVSLWE